MNNFSLSQYLETFCDGTVFWGKSKTNINTETPTGFNFFSIIKTMSYSYITVEDEDNNFKVNFNVRWSYQYPLLRLVYNKNTEQLFTVKS